MTDWSDGYRVDIGYTHGYFRELSPHFARFVLATHGYEPPRAKTPRYLEIGFGQGVSLSIHAAAAGGEFWGLDFNPAHAVAAGTLCGWSGAETTVLDESVQEFAGRSHLPPFDMISLHGVWSWVSQENRNAIVGIAKRALAPGGILYMSYNVSPGFIATLGLRHLLTTYVQRSCSPGEPITVAMERALAFAQRLLESGALYFVNEPAVAKRLEAMHKVDKRYLAHEYFNADWCAMPFADVASAMASAKLEFGASASLEDHLEPLQIAEPGRALLGSIVDPLLRESARDFLVNQQFRRDYFVRGLQKVPGRAGKEALFGTRLMLKCVPREIKLEARGRLGTVALHEGVYVPVIEALAANAMSAKSVREVCAMVDSRDVTGDQVEQALILLVMKGDVAPCSEADGSGDTGMRSFRLNEALMRQATSSGDVTYLASPVIGAGVKVSRIEQLFLGARMANRREPLDYARYVSERLAEHGQSVLGVETPEKALSELEKRAAYFLAHRLQLLCALGVA